MDSENESLIPFAKIFRPSMAEFKDFQKYVEQREMDPELQDYGMYKVIPPPEWKGKRTLSDEDLKKVFVHSPIEQNVQGKLGCYQLLLIPKKSMKLPDYQKKALPFDAETDKKSIDEVENLFWGNITFRSAIYGADVPNQTLFEKGIEWNLTDLPGLLKEGLHTHVLGVNSSYLYIGSWKAMFGWHKEDIDLCSINYNHYGKPKFWYCMPPSECKKLEDFAKAHFPEMFMKCKEFIRHKTIMINPYLLIQAIPDLKIHKMVQYPGEFIVTFGAAYHAGFNWGFNIAEAVNFATPKWLDIVPDAKSCTCIKDSVKMDKIEFLRNILKSPIYSKLPNLKSCCLRCGISREELGLKDEELTTMTISSQSVTPQPTPKKKPMSSRKASTASSLKLDESMDDSPSDSGKQLAKSKKIQKMATTSSQKGPKVKEFIADLDLQTADEAKKEVKKILRQKKFEKLIFESWIQCETCTKWRQYKTDKKISIDELFKNDKFVCTKIPGKRCEDPEEKESEDSFILKET